MGLVIFPEWNSDQRIQALPDYQERDFGLHYGLLTKEFKLLAWAVVLVNRTGQIVHFELVKEVTDEPDYTAALAAVRNLLKNLRHG